MWQMTMSELLSDSYRPEVKHNWANGISDYFCPLCGECVGIYGTDTAHEKGWLYQRDKCRNGHVMDWNI